MKPTQWDECAFRSTIWQIWQDVHDKIGPLREEAYKIFFYKAKKDEIGSEKDEESEVTDEEPDLQRYYVYEPPTNDPQKLSEFAKYAVEASRRFQEGTQRLHWQDRFATLESRREPAYSSPTWNN